MNNNDCRDTVTIYTLISPSNVIKIISVKIFVINVMSINWKIPLINN